MLLSLSLSLSSPLSIVYYIPCESRDLIVTVVKWQITLTNDIAPIIIVQECSRSMGEVHLLVILVVLAVNGGAFIRRSERTSDRPSEWMSSVTQRHYPLSFFLTRSTVNVFPLSPRYFFSLFFSRRTNATAFFSSLSLSLPLSSSRCFSRSNLRTPPHL